MATFAQWVAGARPQTLPAALAPVAAGSGAAVALHEVHPDRAALALLVALALQVGVNYANDYSDGIRGTDQDRVGPFRLTGSQATRPGAVLGAACAAFAVAGLAGCGLVLLSRAWWMLAVGAACLPAAWFYTGGAHPYGYRGWGEVFVFTFFGLVAVMGTTYTQAGRVTMTSFCAAVGIGALASALLVANNLRDIPGDSAAGKRTLAVRLGDARTRVLYAGLVLMPWFAVLPVLPVHAWAALTFLAMPLVVKPLRAILGGATGKALLPSLRETGRVELAYGLLLGLALALPW
jgi:1,4-dihydroxy-2-naphthoate octaprenyltransferase